MPRLSKAKAAGPVVDLVLLKDRARRQVAAFLHEGEEQLVEGGVAHVNEHVNEGDLHRGICTYALGESPRLFLRRGFLSTLHFTGNLRAETALVCAIARIVESRRTSAWAMEEVDW